VVRFAIVVLPILTFYVAILVFEILAKIFFVITGDAAAVVLDMVTSLFGDMIIFRMCMVVLLEQPERSLAVLTPAT